MDSSHLLHARMRAAVEGMDRRAEGARFAEGHELDEAAAALVPARAIARMLDPVEAGELIRRLERGIPKLAATASVRRRAVKRRRA
jgi:hypothetical protein